MIKRLIVQEENKVLFAGNIKINSECRCNPTLWIRDVFVNVSIMDTQIVVELYNSACRGNSIHVQYRSDLNYLSVSSSVNETNQFVIE